MSRFDELHRAAERTVCLWLCLVVAAWALLGALMLWPGSAKAQDMPPAAAAPWRGELLRAAHSQWGLDAPVAVFAAQVHQESGWQPQAVSRVGAQGMAQFMPATARWWCQLQGLQPVDCQPSNPTWALRALVGYDRWLWQRLASADVPPDGAAARMWATLRSYNGGLGHWQAEARLAASPDRLDVDQACGRARRAALHCPENLGYPQRIMVTLQPRYIAWGPTLTLVTVAPRQPQR